MTWTARIALVLLAVGSAGLGLTIWQPEGRATRLEDPPLYYLAISSGPGLRLAASASVEPADQAMACERVFNLGRLAIGASCVGPSAKALLER
jgi:hypothetical protein